MSPNPGDQDGKIQRGSFEREHQEEYEEEEELEADLALPGIANAEMEQAATAARLKSGAKPLSAEALAELTQPWGVSRYISGGDDDEPDSPKRSGAAQADDDDGSAHGSLDAPLWHAIAGAPAPPPRPAGFPKGSKWVRPVMIGP